MVYLALWINLLIRHDFWHYVTGNYLFTELCRTSKCWHVSLHNITTNLITKVFKYWAPVMETDTGFLKTAIFLLRAQILPLATNNVVCFHWSDRLTFEATGSVLRMAVKSLSLNNHNLKNIISNKKITFREKHCQFGSQSVVPVLFQHGRTTMLESAAELLSVYSTSHFITKNGKKMHAHSSRFHTATNYTTLARSFRSEPGVM